MKPPNGRALREPHIHTAAAVCCTRWEKHCQQRWKPWGKAKSADRNASPLDHVHNKEGGKNICSLSPSRCSLVTESRSLLVGVVVRSPYPPQVLWVRVRLAIGTSHPVLGCDHVVVRFPSVDVREDVLPHFSPSHFIRQWIACVTDPRLLMFPSKYCDPFRFEQIADGTQARSVRGFLACPHLPPHPPRQLYAEPSTILYIRNNFDLLK